jgi:hypothetical protein
MATIAMFLARSPRAPKTGRKAVIHTTIAALADVRANFSIDVLKERWSGVIRDLGGRPCFRA